jgi:nucleotide-binding universal stress UspA family protein
MLQPAVLCPVDFSEGTRGALRYAAAIAAHFGTGLTLLAVVDPLLSEALELTGDERDLNGVTVQEVERFVAEALPRQATGTPAVHVAVAAGTPAAEILRVSQAQPCALIVMSARGASGFRKLFFGSTTERVLRDTTVPVLVTPGQDSGPVDLVEGSRLVRRVLAPVDRTATTAHQVEIARAVAEAMSVPLLLLTVVEPLRAPLVAQWRLPSIEAERRSRAERELEALVDVLPPHVRTEALVSYGETAEEIAKVAVSRDAGLIVMGLHASTILGPRMGSVTYRVLCLAQHQLVLALPPSPAGRSELQARGVWSAPPPSPRPHGA